MSWHHFRSLDFGKMVLAFLFYTFCYSANFLKLSQSKIIKYLLLGPGQTCRTSSSANSDPKMSSLLLLLTLSIPPSALFFSQATNKSLGLESLFTDLYNLIFVVHNCYRPRLNWLNTIKMLFWLCLTNQQPTMGWYSSQQGNSKFALIQNKVCSLNWYNDQLWNIVYWYKFISQQLVE